MANLRLLVLVVFLLVLTVSCATPPGKFTESDFVSKDIVLDIPVSQAYRQLLEGLRYCGPASGEATYGIPECMPIEEDGSVLCDLYFVSIYSGRSKFVLGRIELKPHGKGTAASLKVTTTRKRFSEGTFHSWEQFMLGRAKEVCP